MALVLPNEILVKIITASIEPYHLTVTEDWSRRVKKPAKRAARPGDRPYLPALTIDDLYKQWDGPLLYPKLPKVMDMLLVNKMFFHETTTAVRGSFTGSLVVNFDCVKRLVEDLEAGASYHGWLKYKVCLISIRDYSSWRNWIIEPLLDVDCSPALHKIILTDCVTTDANCQNCKTDTDKSNLQVMNDAIFQMDLSRGSWNTLKERKLSLTYNAFFSHSCGEGTKCASLVYTPGTDENKKHMIIVESHVQPPNWEVPGEDQSYRALKSY